MADIISDALGTTAGYSGWDWNTSTSTDESFSVMLIATRVSFVAAMLGFSLVRMQDSPSGVMGIAFKAVSKIILIDNYALIMTVILLMLQSIFALVHAFLLSKFRIDLGLLQLMEIREAAGIHGPSLSGYCAKSHRNTSEGNMKISIRARVDTPYLGILDYKGGRIPLGWH
ncbi:hypothetical protein EDD37DRAFT_683955 [Exophiala viscosa]|uniref:uncharacterized protein n=1 Tax=Exophiala viscosa TaxID=2486360 RepID=UPI0021A08304|nr:hypothetical protein EDD37DRAFT_683955 [Exophiala viscosa]